MFEILPLVNEIQSRINKWSPKVMIILASGEGDKAVIFYRFEDEFVVADFLNYPKLAEFKLLDQVYYRNLKKAMEGYAERAKEYE